MPDPVTAAAAIGWGVKALGWVASPVISELYKKYSSLLSFDEAEKLRQLAPKILLLERVVDVVEESPHRSRLEPLFRDLKSALYEAEDILDDVSYSRLKKQVQDCNKSGLPYKINICHVVLSRKKTRRQDVVEQNQAQLLSVLEGGKRGSKILVTSRNEDAFSDLGPDVRYITVPIGQLDDSTFNELFMYYALGDGGDGSTLRHIGENIAGKLKKSPLAARTVGEQLRKRQNVEYWRRTKDWDLLNETMGALSWSYQHLNEQLRRCFSYCSMFPKGYHFRRNGLVKLWVAEGFIRSTNAGEEMEDVGQDYFDELVSISFMQLRKESWGEDFYVMHDLVHDLAERIAGSDCHRIENGLKGKVPPGIRHLYIDTFDLEEEADLETFELENLRTLIIRNFSCDSQNILKTMFTRLKKLRVLNIWFIDPYLAQDLVSIIGLSKHLRHLALKIHGGASTCEDKINLVSLRHVETDKFWNVVNTVSCTSAQQLGALSFSEKHGHNIEQLRDLNNLRGRLSISHLEFVKSKKEALQAMLADKQRLVGLALSWDDEGSWDSSYDESSCSPEVKLEVLEGLCPQKDLEELIITRYSGPRYPNWMVGRQNGGPNRLQVLDLRGCSLLGLAPVFEVFTQLRVLSLRGCDWVTLPDTMVHLKSLKKLSIYHFPNIEYLPVLPQSIEEFELKRCSKVFTRSCQTVENPNWEKIQHIHKRDIKMEGVMFDDDVLIIGERGTNRAAERRSWTPADFSEEE